MKQKKLLLSLILLIFLISSICLFKNQNTGVNLLSNEQVAVNLYYDRLILIYEATKGHRDYKFLDIFQININLLQDIVYMFCDKKDLLIVDNQIIGFKC